MLGISALICFIIGTVIAIVCGSCGASLNTSILAGYGFATLVFFGSLPKLIDYMIFYDGVDSINRNIRRSQTLSDYNRDLTVSSNTDRILSDMKKIKGGKNTYIDKRKVNINIHKRLD